jgi:hypothetical protein
MRNAGGAGARNPQWSDAVLEEQGAGVWSPPHHLHPMVVSLPPAPSDGGRVPPGGDGRGPPSVGGGRVPSDGGRGPSVGDGGGPSDGGRGPSDGGAGLG